MEQDQGHDHEDLSISGQFDSEYSEITAPRGPLSLNDSIQLDDTQKPFFDDTNNTSNNGFTYSPTSKYINPKDKITYLHRLAQHRKGDCQGEIETFVKLGCGVNDKTTYGHTPLHVAVVWGNIDFIRELFKFCSNNPETNLNLSIKDSKEDDKKNGKNTDETAFERCVDNYLECKENSEKYIRHINIIKLFLDHHTISRISPGYFPLHSLISQKDIKFKPVLDLVDINYLNLQDMYGDSLAHKAARFGNEEILQYLIKRIANINLKNNLGRLPIHEAALNKNQAILQVLLDAGGCNISEKDNYGKTVLDYAIESNYLLNIYTLINSQEVDYAPLMKVIKNCSAGFDKQDIKNINSIINGDLNSILQKNKFGLNALHVCVINSNYLALKFLLDELREQKTLSVSDFNSILDSQDNFKNNLLQLSSICNCIDSGEVIRNFKKMIQ